MTEPVHIRSKLLFLGLTQIKGVGFKTMRDLGGPLGVAAKEAEGTLLPTIASLTGTTASTIKRQAMLAGVRTNRMLRKAGVELLTQADDRYPVSYRHLSPDIQPLWLFCKGDISLLQSPSIAVVGTREPTSEGVFLTQYAARTVQEFSVPLVSGLALGVDAIAHETAIASGVPNISVLGTGILRAYPARNAWMAEAIVGTGGLLISEYFPDAEPAADQFVWRNRLQAALSACVIPTQWKKSSGTAHTVRFAKSFGKPTINLVPNGMKISDDHGISDYCFTVPMQHEELKSRIYDCLNKWPEPIRQATTKPENLASKQTTLFG